MKIKQILGFLVLFGYLYSSDQPGKLPDISNEPGTLESMQPDLQQADIEFLDSLVVDIGFERQFKSLIFDFRLRAKNNLPYDLKAFLSFYDFFEILNSLKFQKKETLIASIRSAILDKLNRLIYRNPSQILKLSQKAINLLKKLLGCQIKFDKLLVSHIDLFRDKQIFYCFLFEFVLKVKENNRIFQEHNLSEEIIFTIPEEASLDFIKDLLYLKDSCGPNENFINRLLNEFEQLNKFTYESADELVKAATLGVNREFIKQYKQIPARFYSVFAAIQGLQIIQYLLDRPNWMDQSERFKNLVNAQLNIDSLRELVKVPGFGLTLYNYINIYYSDASVGSVLGFLNEIRFALILLDSGFIINQFSPTFFTNDLHRRAEFDFLVNETDLIELKTNEYNLYEKNNSQNPLIEQVFRENDIARESSKNNYFCAFNDERCFRYVGKGRGTLVPAPELEKRISWPPASVSAAVPSTAVGVQPPASQMYRTSPIQQESAVLVQSPTAVARSIASQSCAAQRRIAGLRCASAPGATTVQELTAVEQHRDSLENRRVGTLSEQLSKLSAEAEPFKPFGA